MELTDTRKRIRRAAELVEDAAAWVAVQPWPDDVHVNIGAGTQYTTKAIVSVDVLDLDTFRAVRRIVGPVERSKAGGRLYFIGDPLPGMTVHIDLPADTCERVQVGEKTVPVYETRCPESVLALTGDREEVPA